MTNKTPRVLVVDDQQDVARTLTAPLARAGMDVAFAVDGEEGLRMASTGIFDLLVVDMRMPPGEWGGLWLLEQLKGANIRTPTVVMSGEGAARQVKAALRLGAVDWVDKGEAHLELHDRCIDVLSRSHSKTSRADASDPLRALLNEPESQRLERKSSFITPIGSKNPNTTSADIQHAAGKSIAALANTDGGHLIIGQSDDGTVIGLAPDFAQLKNRDRDGFALRFVQYTDNCLSHRWEVLGLRLHWISVGELSVAVVEIPRSSDIVALIKGKEQQIYVRRETRTDSLQGLDLVNWSRTRTAR